MRWSSDSRRFTFVYNQRGHQVSASSPSSETATARPIVDETSKTFIDYAQKIFAYYLDEKPMK